MDMTKFWINNSPEKPKMGQKQSKLNVEQNIVDSGCSELTEFVELLTLQSTP